MKYNCIIIDDEQQGRRLLENYCNKIDNLVVVGSYKSAIHAFEGMRTNDIDIIFLDIQMPELSGIDFLKSLKRNKAKVILTTAYREYALEGFELDAIDYLLKPIGFSRFLRAIEKVKEIHEKSTSNVVENIRESGKETIQIKSNKKQYKVSLLDILYIQSENEYISYITKTYGKLMVYGTLKNVIDTLPNTSFIRIHRSYIVNLSHIKYVEGNRVCIEDNFLPISETYRKTFFNIWDQ